MSFTFNAGENPQLNQTWSLDDEFTIAGHKLKITSARVTNYEDTKSRFPDFNYDSQGYEYGYDFAVVSDSSVNFRGDSLKAWFMRILVNKCYDKIRYMQRIAAISLDESLTEDGENGSLYIRLQDHVPSVEECVEISEWNECIQECLNKLPTHYRTTLTLVDIDEMSYGEASAILKIPLGTVKSHLARAQLSLRRD